MSNARKSKAFPAKQLIRFSLRDMMWVFVLVAACIISHNGDYCSAWLQWQFEKRNLNESIYASEKQIRLFQRNEIGFRAVISELEHGKTSHQIRVQKSTHLRYFPRTGDRIDVYAFDASSRSSRYRAVATSVLVVRSQFSKKGLGADVWVALSPSQLSEFDCLAEGQPLRISMISDQVHLKRLARGRRRTENDRSVP